MFILFSAAAIEKTHLTKTFAKGKEKNHCCAGTITINLEEVETSFSPSLELHKDFIAKAIPDALCMLLKE